MKKLVMLFMFLSSSLFANDNMCSADLSEHDMSKMSQMNKDYIAAMDLMHKPMMKGAMNPDPDVAFVEGMIPHHEGAIKMAEIELKYGKDPKIKALARDVITAQTKEIKFMKEWLKTHQDKK